MTPETAKNPQTEQTPVVQSIEFNKADRSWMFQFDSWIGKTVDVKMRIATDISKYTRTMMEKINWTISVEVNAFRDPNTDELLEKEKLIKKLVIHIPPTTFPVDPHQVLPTNMWPAILEQIIYDAQMTLITDAARGWAIHTSNQFNPRAKSIRQV